MLVLCEILFLGGTAGRAVSMVGVLKLGSYIRSLFVEFLKSARVSIFAPVDLSC